jgi:hypothetical protein
MIKNLFCEKVLNLVIQKRFKINRVGDHFITLVTDKSKPK